MDTRIVTRPPLPSTRAIIAGAHLCDQVSALLLIEPEVCRQAFLGEPVKEVMAMVKWALKHEGEATFDPERIPTVTGVSVIVQSPLVANSSGPLTGRTFYASVKIESIAPTPSTATSGVSA